MSTSLSTSTTLGLMPLAIGILLRHYYGRVLKDKNRNKNSGGAAIPVPLRLEELMYDEAFTITRVSLFHLPVSFNPKSIQHFRLCSTELYGLGNKVRPSLSLPSLLSQSVRVVIPSRSSSNSRSSTRPRGPRPTLCASPFRRRAAKRRRAYSCAPSVVRMRRDAWSVACAGGKYVRGTAGTSLDRFPPVVVLMGAYASTQDQRGVGHG